MNELEEIQKFLDEKYPHLGKTLRRVMKEKEKPKGISIRRCSICGWQDTGRDRVMIGDVCSECNDQLY